MALRVLFGPVPAAFAADRLREVRRSGHCLTFGPGEGHDVIASCRDGWTDVAARLPRGWRPDFLALWLAFRPLPAWVWTVPIPLIGLATDWDRRWHWHRSKVHRCDVVLTDPPGVRALATAGFERARAANLFGLGHAHLEGSPETGHRDIDVLFVGDFSTETHPERQAWLARLADLIGRRIVVTSGVSDDEYRSLLRRSRIVVNHSGRGGYNQRTFEALAAGTVLFQEETNVEVARLLTPGRDYAPYGHDEFESSLERYLKDDAARATMAVAGRARASDFSFENLWRSTAESLTATLPHLRDRVRQRVATSVKTDWTTIAWELPAVRLPDESVPAYVRGLASQSSTDAADHFATAFAENPGHALAGLAVVDACLASGRQEEAVQAARRALDALALASEAPDPLLDLPPYAPELPRLVAEWDRTARLWAGNPEGEARAKREMIRGRLHAVLAGLTGELSHYYESALATPHSPETRISLGCALARAGRMVEALPHLRMATMARPFDAAAARALAIALGETGNGLLVEALIDRLSRLHRIAPQALPAQPWFGPT
ncbi:MAG: glycosyltransferase [Gemmataceae bacterium]